eukprot:CAMPEP_0115015706 /NCGR_PEP_ID=MMETSP0216-20121206/26941_1 /TAXON_ID=223996 /ORGANISM="Protocruzia adherens, Strain Boccale" /LENGTH=171 /DNA_ID=CAMNT_0002385903 /DNA_START=57 /DNA_END=572 /DNA_ORIENTATION=-
MFFVRQLSGSEDFESQYSQEESQQNGPQILCSQDYDWSEKMEMNEIAEDIFNNFSEEVSTRSGSSFNEEDELDNGQNYDHIENFDSAIDNLLDTATMKLENRTRARTSTEVIVLPNGRFKCGYCDKTYKDRPSVYNHINPIHKNIRFECETCGKQYFSRQALERHQLSKDH